jgi:predicted transcriptional regulator
MDKLILLFTVLSDKIRIRIVKLLIKKMCTSFELAEIFQTTDDEMKAHLNELRHSGLISEVTDGEFVTYFVKGSGAIFDKYTQDVLNIISKNFNSDEVVLNDYTKSRTMNRDEVAKKRGIS